MNAGSRFSLPPYGQHSMCGIAASCVSWAPQRALKHSDFVMAVGELDSVRVWALSSGNALLSISSLPQSCNCVWLSPDGERLACAGGSGKLMVWKLPEIVLRATRQRGGRLASDNLFTRNWPLYLALPGQL